MVAPPIFLCLLKQQEAVPVTNWDVFNKGTTGTGTGVLNHADALGGRVGIEFQVEAIGATPTLTFAVEGSLDGINWVTLDTVSPDATVAASNAPITVTTVSKTWRYLDGLGLRFFSALRINVTANTNVTYSARFLTPAASGGF
jgi:hypothetical protein